MLCYVLDIAYAMSVTRRYQSNPDLKHWTTVKCILKHLRMIKDLLLVYGEGDLRVNKFTDSDFQSNLDNRKSTFGFVLACNGKAVSWKSSK